VHWSGRVQLTATLERPADVRPTALVGEVRDATGAERTVVLTDDGLSGDGLAGDGRYEPAQQHLTAVLQTLIEDSDRASLRQWVHYVAYRFFKSQNQLDQAKNHLRRAETAMLETAAPLSPADRDQFLKRVPLNHRIGVAVAEFAQQITVRLARDDAPLGRRLTTEDYKTVAWTIYALEDDQIDNAIERRRHILRRFLAEAAAQGTTPTDDDLAAALGVSRRTILRDMQTLSPSGPTATTRRRSSGH
jgi:hypothetical protein